MALPNPATCPRGRQRSRHRPRHRRAPGRLTLLRWPLAPPTSDPTQDPELHTTDFLARLLADAAPDNPPRLAGIALNAYAAVLGYLTAEAFGSLDRLVPDPDQLSQAHLRNVLLGMGFHPSLIKAAATTTADQPLAVVAR